MWFAITQRKYYCLNSLHRSKGFSDAFTLKQGLVIFLSNSINLLNKTYFWPEIPSKKSFAGQIGL